MTDKLLPCPFCGGQAEMRESSTHDFYVKCKDCGAATRRNHENRNGAVMDWNARAELTCEEIVRCRDCEHIVWTDNPMTSTHYWCIENDRPCGLDGFCSLAERRENGGIESIYDWQWVRDLVGEDEAERRKEKQKAVDA